jgi:hypothetical protein
MVRAVTANQAMPSGAGAMLRRRDHPAASLLRRGRSSGRRWGGRQSCPLEAPAMPRILVAVLLVAGLALFGLAWTTAQTATPGALRATSTAIIVNEAGTPCATLAATPTGSPMAAPLARPSVSPFFPSPRAVMLASPSASPGASPMAGLMATPSVVVLPGCVTQPATPEGS